MASPARRQVGFSAADVESVCDVGASAKPAAARSDGTSRIGCKGIGFKSVFMVSDEPTICSRAATYVYNYISIYMTIYVYNYV